MKLSDVRTSDRSTINDAVKEVPSRPKEFLKRSLVVLLSADRTVWDRALRLAADAFDSPFSIDEADLGRDFGMTTSDAKHIVNAATFFGAMLTAHPEATPAVFIASLLEHGMLDQSNKDSALELAELVASGRAKLTEDFEKSTLRNIVLPSLRRLDTSVDVRLSGSESETIVAVPVLLVMLDTDADRETLWFQVSKQELKSLIQKLNKSLERMEIAERWIEGKNDRTEA